MDDELVEATVRDDDEADFRVSESGVGTVAREGGPTDTVTVVLSAAPLSDAVFFVRTDDAVRDGIGFRTITIAVDPDQSDEAFHGLSRTIDAITFDNDLSRASGSGPGD